MSIHRPSIAHALAKLSKFVKWSTHLSMLLTTISKIAPLQKLFSPSAMRKHMMSPKRCCCFDCRMGENVLHLIIRTVTGGTTTPRSDIYFYLHISHVALCGRMNHEFSLGKWHPNWSGSTSVSNVSSTNANSRSDQIEILVPSGISLRTPNGQPLKSASARGKSARAEEKNWFYDIVSSKFGPN